VRAPKPPALGHWRSGVLGHASFEAMMLHRMDQQEWTDVSLGARIGVSSTTVYNWRMGKYAPTARDLARLATAFGVPICITAV